LDIQSDQVNNYQQVVEDLKELTLKLMIRAIQLEKANQLNDFLFTEENLRPLVVDYVKDTFGENGMIDSSVITSTITAQLEAFNQKTLKAYTDLLDFQSDPLQLFANYINAIIGGIRANTIPINQKNRKVSLDTITELIRVASGLPSRIKERDQQFVSWVARTYIRSACRSAVTWEKAFFTDLYINILNFFFRTHQLININEAKRLVVEFFLPEDYPEPPKEYVKFLMVKFVEEGFKDDALYLEPTYRKLREVYIIDLLHASITHKYELMTEKELQHVIVNFEASMKLITVEDMAAFRDFRPLLINNRDLLETYEQFFSTFYNVGLFFVEYSAWNRRGLRSSGDSPKSTGKFAVVFDQFLHTCWKGDGGFWSSLFNARVPDRTVFDTSVIENYPAYKIINMQAAPSDFFGRTVSFASYDDLQDKNIEELLFENPRFNTLILAIKETYLHNVGLNYGSFKGIQIDPSFWRSLAKTRPDLFPKLSISDVI
jgi:hypothetical protein